MADVWLDEAGIHELFTDPGGPVGAIMARKAFAVENTAREELLRPGTGHTYEPGHYDLFKDGKHYAWDRTLPGHTASSPGQPPASDTGVLLASLHHEMVGTDDGIGARIGSDSPVANFTELGTRLMYARPFLRPALDAADATITEEEPNRMTLPPGKLTFTPRR